MIIIYSLIGAIEKFPYLALPFIILIAFAGNWAAVKLHFSSEARILFVILASAAISTIVIVPSWLLYKHYEGLRGAQEDKAFMAQFPVSAADAISSVAARPEVADILARTSAERNERSSDAELSWEGVPDTIPAKKDGFPLLSYSTETQGDSLLYSVYVTKEDGEILLYKVNATTGEVVAE
jgi:hypothetical protein